MPRFILDRIFTEIYIVDFFSLSAEGDTEMSSNRKRTKIIRANKAKPNKANLKKNQKRIQENIEILRELPSKE